jgi:hypothetical protein
MEKRVRGNALLTLPKTVHLSEVANNIRPCSFIDTPTCYSDGNPHFLHVLFVSPKNTSIYTNFTDHFNFTRRGICEFVCTEIIVCRRP